MLLNLASMYGKRVKEPINHNRLPYTEEKYALVGIATHVSTFQKLSLVILDLIALFMAVFYCYLVSICSSIITKISSIPKQIITLIVALLPVFTSYSSFASDIKTIEKILGNVEQDYAIPRGLLGAIAKVESGVKPYVLNINGKPVFTSNQEEALQIITEAQGQGITNIDIGVMQLNYRWHRDEFSSLKAMLDIQNNIVYAARFLQKLKQQHGDWQTAVQHYHSARPEHHRPYAKKVLMAWIGG